MNMNILQFIIKECSIKTATIQRTGRLFVVEVVKNDFIKKYHLEEVWMSVQHFKSWCWGFRRSFWWKVCHGKNDGEWKGHGIFREWPVERDKVG